MITVTAGQPLKDVVALCGRARRPLLLVGRHGIGKSEILAEVAQDHNIGFVSRDLSLMEPVDLVGLPRIEDGRTVYSPPAFLPTDGLGLLVFEEINRCERHMRAPCLQLLTARTLNDYVLPPGWLPVACINPDSDDYHVDSLDPALASRFVQVEVVPDRQQWLAWANGHGVHRAVLEYVGNDETVFDEPESNPRAWTAVSDLLHAAGNATDPETLRAAIVGCVGLVRGTAFLSGAGGRSPLTVEEVLGSDRHAQQVQSWIREGRIDLVQATLQRVLIALQPEDDYVTIHADHARWSRLGRFLNLLPGDLQQQADSFFADRGYAPPRTTFQGGAA
jgi:MoxR-like ATPase